MVKVSIIVPVYNVEKYLEKCLDSLINQTLKDIEIICVNDGSKDNSLKILEKYSQKDNRIIIINQDNAGLSVARNSGIDIAKGEYIGFVDSDDWVDLDFYEKLYNSAIKNDADIAVSSIIRWRKYNKKYRVKYEDKVYTTLQEKISACFIPKICYVWNKLYKTHIVQNKHFTPNVYFEDIIWLPEVIKSSNKLITVSGVNYYYRVNSGSIVKKTSKKKQQDNYNAKKVMIKFFNDNGLVLSKKERTIVKFSKSILNIPLLKIKEIDSFLIYLLFDLIPIAEVENSADYRITLKLFNLFKIKITKNKKSDDFYKNANLIYETENSEKPKVLSCSETLEELINSNKSICRYGDGEFNIIFGESIPFQSYDVNLKNRLKDILIASDENILCGIPDVFGSLDSHNPEHAKFWYKYLYYNRKKIYNIINFNKCYVDTGVSRSYLEYLPSIDHDKFFEELKSLWKNKNIVIVEGNGSRLGVGNDLFNSAKSIKRILCPSKNAFSKYDEILNNCISCDKESLFIIALGPTATVLAYDLSKKGFKALDFGHVDIEYEWYLKKATHKVPVKNKIVNEIRSCRSVGKIKDEKYDSEILTIIN